MDLLRQGLSQFFEFVHNLIKFVVADNPNVSYGLAIILFTIIIRVILLPLNIKQTRSQVKMQEIQPEIQKLQTKYKNDPQKAQQEMSKIYKENGVSPLSGCLPLLIQMPILFALYYVFYNLPNIDGVSFLWLPNLAAKDPYFILPVLSFATTYISSSMVAAKNKDNPQAKSMSSMNIMMAGMMGFMSINFKSALVLYWVVNNLIQIAQTYVMKRLEENKKSELNGAIAKEVSSDVDEKKNRKNNK